MMDIFFQKERKILEQVSFLNFEGIIVTLKTSKRVKITVTLLCSLSDWYPWERYELPYPLPAIG